MIHTIVELSVSGIDVSMESMESMESMKKESMKWLYFDEEASITYTF